MKKFTVDYMWHQIHATDADDSKCNLKHVRVHLMQSLFACFVSSFFSFCSSEVFLHVFTIPSQVFATAFVISLELPDFILFKSVLKTIALHFLSNC